MFSIRAIRKQLTLSACAVGLLAGTALQAQEIVGRTVSGYNSTTQVGSVNSDGSVNFYALLNGSGTYGVSNAGMSADTCTRTSGGGDCGGGVLDMWFRFSGVALGPNVLTLRYTDLDLAGVNDPTYFLESVAVYRGNSNTPIADIDAESDYGVNQLLSTDVNQLIALNITVNSSPTFYVRTRYITRFTSSAPNGTYTNTIESVRATLVPEPGMLSLLGAGLIVAGVLGRRRRQALKA